MNKDIKLGLNAAREREQDLCECPQPYPDERGRTIIDESCHLHGVMDLLDCTDANPNNTKHKPGWTPAPDPRQYAKVDPYRGRDYEALTKAAKRKPVGWWGDEPNTGVGNGSCPKRDATASKQGVAPLAPTHSAPPPADVWPKYALWGDVANRFDGPSGHEEFTNCGAHSHGSASFHEVAAWPDARIVPATEFYVWLRAHGHAAEADKWEPKPATLRAWKSGDGLVFWVLADGVLYVGNNPWERSVRKLSDMANYAELPAEEAMRLNEERLKCQAKPA